MNKDLKWAIESLTFNVESLESDVCKLFERHNIKVKFCPRCKHDTSMYENSNSTFSNSTLNYVTGEWQCLNCGKKFKESTETKLEEIREKE